jgi:uncharacterized protein (TIGR02145 family)
MKKLLFVIMFSGTLLLKSQVPEFFNYQAIVRDAAGEPIVSQTVSIWLTIYKTAPAGTNVYSEKHSPKTNEFGLVTLALGNGTSKTGVFTAIDWGSDSYFLNVQIDPEGGTAYTDMGTTQLLSVPYAMHAKTVADNDDADADPENELQDLTIDGFNLGITNGSGVTIPSLWEPDGQGIKYDGGKVLITPTMGDVQLELADVFAAGGKNLIIGDDAYITDVDQSGTLGIFGLEYPAFGALMLGEDGLILSKDFTTPVPGILNIIGTSDPEFGIGGISFGLLGPVISNFPVQDILFINNKVDPHSGTIKLGDVGPTLSGTYENLSIDKNLNMNNLSVINVSDPINKQDAATKAYVDELRSLIYRITDPSILLGAGIPISDLLAAGVSVSDLMTAGVSVADLVAAGANVADLLAAGVSITDLMAAGASVADLLAAGVTVSDLLAAGVSVADLINADASVSDLFNAGIGVGTLEQNGATSQELIDAGLIGTLNDANGKTYKWIKIGNQIWMGENLGYLPSVVGPAIGSATTSYYYVAGYDGTDVNAAKATANYATYGVLYNWPAAMNGAGSSSSNPSGIQGVCPTGWHLPSDDECTTLVNYLIANGYNYDGTTTENKIGKSLASTSGWSSSSIPGTVGNTDYPEIGNATGFTALPGGYCAGAFFNIGSHTHWWSTTEDNGTKAWSHNLASYCINEGKWNETKSLGFSVRCVKD